MGILPRASTPVVPTPAAPTCRAQSLEPPQLQALADAALAAMRPITQLAQEDQVSRKFVYQQVTRL
jgi:hypothetical protein